MITVAVFWNLVAQLGDRAAEDIAWSEALKPPANADEFALEAVFVICNSGMKNTVALRIFERCKTALLAGAPVALAFKHQGKAAAIELIWRNRVALLDAFLAAGDRLAYLETLPWIGSITKYHLAKNFGVDVAKPDVHLVRLADREGCTVQAMCERLATETGLRVATVDTVLWRACANGVLDSRTGRVRIAGASV